MKIAKIAVVVGLACGAGCLSAQNAASAPEAEKIAEKISVTHTDTAEFPPGGVLRMPNAVGELTITGWDQPGLEITTIKSTKTAVLPKDRDRAGKLLDSVKVTTERKGDEVTVATAFPKHSKIARPFLGMTDFDMEYRIHVPRSARLDVKSVMGEIHIEAVSGEIHAQENLGEITVRLPGGMYSIDAKAKLGAVNSDFPGDMQRVKWFGESFRGNSSGAVQNLFLRALYGDILILKIH